MRTTLTLDDDVAALLEQARRQRRVSLKQLVNDALRLGLPQLEAKREPAKRRYTHPTNAGRPLVDNFDDIDELLRLGEGEAYRWRSSTSTSSSTNSFGRRPSIAPHASGSTRSSAAPRASGFLG